MFFQKCCILIHWNLFLCPITDESDWRWILNNPLFEQMMPIVTDALCIALHLWVKSNTDDDIWLHRNAILLIVNIDRWQRMEDWGNMDIQGSRILPIKFLHKFRCHLHHIKKMNFVRKLRRKTFVKHSISLRFCHKVYFSCSLLYSVC